MALASGEGNEMYKPLSIALLGGLTVSTMFTLVIVPTVYAAIRNRIPLKDYKAKDEASVESGANIDEAFESVSKNIWFLYIDFKVYFNDIIVYTKKTFYDKLYIIKNWRIKWIYRK